MCIDRVLEEDASMMNGRWRWKCEHERGILEQVGGGRGEADVRADENKSNTLSLLWKIGGGVLNVLNKDVGHCSSLHLDLTDERIELQKCNNIFQNNDGWSEKENQL